MSISMPCRRSATAASVASRVKSPEVAPRPAAAVALAYLLSEHAASSHGQREGSHSSGGVGWSEARRREGGAAFGDALERRVDMIASLGGGVRRAGRRHDVAVSHLVQEPVH